LWQEDTVVVVEGRLNTRDGELKMICEKALAVSLPNPEAIETV